jgi:hypothetical protein
METGLVEHSGSKPGADFDILKNSGAAMSPKELCIAFLWHMHQPDYRDLQFWYNLTWGGRELRRPENVSLFILALDDGREMERFPTTGFFNYPYRSMELR